MTMKSSCALAFRHSPLFPLTVLQFPSHTLTMIALYYNSSSLHHCPSLCLTLSHSPSFPPHYPQTPLFFPTLPHSISIPLTHLHCPSLFPTLLHSTSIPLTHLHCPSLFPTLPHSTSIPLQFPALFLTVPHTHTSTSSRKAVGGSAS